jgi:hypothetical protein
MKQNVVIDGSIHHHRPTDSDTLSHERRSIAENLLHPHLDYSQTNLESENWGK